MDQVMDQATVTDQVMDQAMVMTQEVTS
jgi:hypothetical protein